MKKRIFFLGAWCLFSLCTVAQETTKLTAAKHNQYGLVYSLPHTVLTVEVEATKVTAKRGPYYQYAEKYLGTPATITEDAEYWELDKVRLHAEGRPDKNEEYLVQFKSGSAPYMMLNKEGLLLSVNTDPQPEEDLFVPAKGGKIVSSLADNEYYSVFSEELVMSGSISNMAGVAAKQLFHIRESRTSIITGEADQMPADGESMKLVMKQLDDQEQALVALFMGTVTKEKVVRQFEVMPTGAMQNEVLFRFSTFLGIVEADNLAGEPVYMNLEVTEQGKLPVDAKGRELKMPKNGLAYRIPGKALVSIRIQDRSLYKASCQVAQFGVVFALDPKMFDHKKSPAKVQFFPQTGAIKELTQ